MPEDVVQPTEQPGNRCKTVSAALHKSTHVIAKNSGHYIQLDRPDLVSKPSAVL